MAADEMLAPLFLEVARVDTDTDAEAMGDLWQRVEIAKKRMRELSTRLEAAMLEHVTANGDLTVGTLRFYAGKEKTVTCTDKAETLLNLFGTIGGHFTLDKELADAVANVLAAEPFKYGEARKVLGDMFPETFRVETVPDLRTGKAKKVLKQADTRYIASAPSNRASAGSGEGRNPQNGETRPSPGSGGEG